MKGSPIKSKQKLSPKASAAKATRDKKAAMSEWGKYKKRTAQRAGCKAGYDFDHDAGAVIQGVKLLGTKMLQNKFKTAMVGGAVTDFSMQNNNQGFFEKALRTADSWTTGGVISGLYDVAKNETTEQKDNRTKKDSENVYNVGKPKY